MEETGSIRLWWVLNLIIFVSTVCVMIATSLYADKKISRRTPVADESGDPTAHPRPVAVEQENPPANAPPCHPLCRLLTSRSLPTPEERAEVLRLISTGAVLCDRFNGSLDVLSHWNAVIAPLCATRFWVHRYLDTRGGLSNLVALVKYAHQPPDPRLYALLQLNLSYLSLSLSSFDNQDMFDDVVECLTVVPKFARRVSPNGVTMLERVLAVDNPRRGELVKLVKALMTAGKDDRALPHDR